MAHTVPVSTSENDPFGTEVLRSLEDTRRVNQCPLAEIAKGNKNGNNNVFKLIEDDWDFVNEKAKEANDAKNPHKKVAENKGSWAFGNAIWQKIPFLTRRGDSLDEVGSVDDKETDESKVAKLRFQALVEVFNKLSGNKWIKRAHSYQRVHREHEAMKTPNLLKLWYVIRPMFVFFFAFGFQSFMLHITTHLYIVYIKQEKGENEREKEGGQLLDIAGNLVAKYLSGNNSTLHEGAVYKGHVDIPMWLLDASAAIPLAMCCLAYGLSFPMKSFNIGLWNKTYIVASLMALIKGSFDVVTILPDSIGWQNCEDRLSKEGVKSLYNLDFGKRFWQSLLYQLWTEISGGGGKKGARVRYCADMMVSGHTYFAILFSMASYKQIAYNTEIFPGKHNRKIRFAVFGLCIVCLCTEMALVAAARFHYTVDMFASVVLVVLLYDSRHIEQIAANWSEGFDWQDSSTFEDQHWFLFGLRFKLSKLLFGETAAPSKYHRIVPSQSTCFNHQRFAGTNLNDEPADFIDDETADEREKLINIS